MKYKGNFLVPICFRTIFSRNVYISFNSEKKTRFNGETPFYETRFTGVSPLNLLFLSLFIFCAKILIASSSLIFDSFRSDFPLVQTKIVDFFRIQRPFQSVDGKQFLWISTIFLHFVQISILGVLKCFLYYISRRKEATENRLHLCEEEEQEIACFCPFKRSITALEANGFIGHCNDEFWSRIL